MSNKLKGILLAAGGGSLWGISGILAQLLFADYAVSSEWLVSTRLLMAGILILFYSHAVKREGIFVIFRQKRDIIRLLLFAVFGMVACQYLFFKAIEMSSASLAAILQFTAPIFVYLYMLVKKEKRFNPAEGGLVLATFAGVLLIVTKGDFSQIAVSPLGLALGIGSAIGVAFYTLQPRLILKKYGSPVVVGWGMFIGGVLFQFIHPFWAPGFAVTAQSMLLTGAIILFGTAVAFLAYLESVKYIEASLASVMTALEPLLAAVLSVLVLGTSVGLFEWLGIAIVLGSVLLLSNFSRFKEKSPSRECGKGIL